MIAFPWITLLTAVPIVGALVLLVLGGRNKDLARWSALAFSFAALVLTLVLWRHFDPASGSLQFQERHAWISALGVEYRVGIDGLGLLMLLLSSIVVPIGMVASWQIEERVPLYYSLVLILQACLFGTFTALNFFHWFIFWELSLIPAFFPHQALGRAAPHQRGYAVFGLHDGWQHYIAAGIYSHLSRY